MKYAAIVLRNNKNPLSSVAYESVHDALLSGGVFLDEIVFVSYDAPVELNAAITRLIAECDAVVIICDGVLIPSAKKAVQNVTGVSFMEDFLLETETCLVAVLPDGDRGAETVKSETVPRIDARRNNSFSRVVIGAVSVPADMLANTLKQAREAAKGRLEIHASEKYGCTRVEMIYDCETPKMIADEVLRILANGLEGYIYTLEDVSLAEQLFNALKLHKLRVSTAESFTAGGVGRAIVGIPGASEVFFEGLNTYNNQSKTERLGVSDLTIMSKGAVSDETAYEMAAGLIAQGNCDVAIATTGIAGPNGGGADKPVGTCFIAIGTKERVRVFRYRLSGDRKTITETAVNFALFLAYKEIK